MQRKNAQTPLQRNLQTKFHEKQRTNAAEAELAQCKQRISEIEAQYTKADAKAKEWEQKSDARCKDIGAMRMQLQGVTEQQLQSEQKQKDADQRVEAAEARAKEWETKCTVLKEQLDQMLAHNVQREYLQETEDSVKRKHVKHFETNEEELTFKNNISSFLQTNFQVSQYAFVPTKTMHQLFTEHTGHMPNNQVFCKIIRNQMIAIFPTATICERRFAGERERGYNGIQLMN
jgi:chromosome segregation ATPase